MCLSYNIGRGMNNYRQSFILRLRSYDYPIIHMPQRPFIEALCFFRASVLGLVGLFAVRPRIAV